MQRHSVLFIPSRICASVGFGCLSSSTLAVMICPFWQKPHCGTCSSIHACCSGCSLPSLATPSSVVISPLPGVVGVMRERVAAPFMITVHAPHWPSPQPNRGPCKPRSLRRIYSSGVERSTSKACILPFTFNVILLILHSPYEFGRASRSDGDDFTRYLRLERRRWRCRVRSVRHHSFDSQARAGAGGR